MGQLGADERRAQLDAKVQDACPVANPAELQLMRALLDVVNGLNKPCLRLEMMQAILGLDDRWERDYLVASLLFAYECVLTSSGGSTNKPAKQPVHQALAAAAARRGTRLR